jgi:2-polyprenyl-3-methyl-5-hydroxy-6-metoxy-1,4-benzoquinol methylase
MDHVLKEEISCVVCDSGKYIKHLPEFELDIVKCTKCNIAFRIPIISSNELEEIYSDKYPSLIDEKYLEKFRLKLFEDILKEINRKPKVKGSLLDIGCGYGKFMEMAANNGWDAVGTELYDKACEFINKKKKIKAYYGELKNIEFKENSFDIITLWHVLHHMFNPKEQLSEIHRILKPEGEVFIRSPNFSFNYLSYKMVRKLDKIIAKIFHKNFDLSSKIAVFHNTNYSRSSLENLLKQSGFLQIEIRNGKPTWGDPYKAFPKLGNGTISFIKKVAFSTFNAVSMISKRKVLLGPSIEVWAKKG